MAYNGIFSFSIKPIETDSKNCWIVRENNIAFVFYYNPSLHGQQPLELFPATMEKYVQDVLTKQQNNSELSFDYNFQV